MNRTNFFGVQRSILIRIALGMIGWTIAFSPSRAQQFYERFEDWPIECTIPGTIGIVDRIHLTPDALAKILGAVDDKILLLITTQPIPESDFEKLKSTFAEVRTIADGEDADLTDVDVVLWFSETIPFDVSQRLVDQLQSVRDLGKVLLAVGPSSKLLGKYSIALIREGHPSVDRGMNLLPDCIVGTQVTSIEATSRHILSVLASFPQSVGVMLEPETSLLLEGRKIRVFGKGQAHFRLSANERVPIRAFAIADRKSRNQSSSEWLVDLTEWRRDAMDRTLEAFPPAEVQKPNVPNGTLMIVGGGKLPDGLMQRFVELAGGVDDAKLVYIPCSEEKYVAPEDGMIKTWRMMGVQNVALVHTKDRNIANRDAGFLEPLRHATGVWFGGGRQWNLADSYYGTTAHRLMKEVVQRGGIIGGSSAGASIQAQYLARATPIENFRIMAPGYERGGLGFIEGVAIDQHFSQRKRHRDMTQLVNRYPQLLGIGIDETTAIVVEQSLASVVGEGKVYFYDRTRPVDPDRPDYIQLSAGQTFDLASREQRDTEASR